MTESFELAVLSDVTARLKSAGFDYILTASVALNYYLQPRITRDIDIVISLVDPDSSEIVSLSEGDYYVSADAVADATRQQSMFNIVHLDGVVKADFIVRKKQIIADSSLTDPDLDYLHRWSTVLEVDQLLKEIIYE